MLFSLRPSAVKLVSLPVKRGMSKDEWGHHSASEKERTHSGWHGGQLIVVEIEDLEAGEKTDFVG
jgi:hypothetical protein